MGDMNFLTVAGKHYTLEEALEVFVSYPSGTPPRFDYPSRGEPGVITAAEIQRTHAVSSRISHAQRDYFISTAKTAPWIDPDADLASADPQERGGLFDAMHELYVYFFNRRPERVNFAKISKVLHLKYPAAFPMIDSRLREKYREAAAELKTQYPERGWRERTWIAVREDLVRARESGALTELRDALKNYESDDVTERDRIASLANLTDLRMLDILTW